MTQTETVYYAIEEKQERWTVVAMTTNRDKAHKIKQGINNDHSGGWNRQARVVKAAPEIVKAYFMMGNKLWD